MEAVVTVVTFEDIFQREAEKKGKYSEDYRKFSAQIILDKQDMAGLGVKDGQNVLVKNDVGNIVVVAKASDDPEEDPHPGLAFMIGSPWSNQLVKDEVCARISAQVSPSAQDVTQISELFQRMTAKGT
jgi:formylmethanofuran dehydrogenase subunit D